MGKSYRKPYASVTGHRPSHDDKTQAARGVRRTQNSALRSFQLDDWDEFIMPVRFECPWNNVYSWSRDGKQRLQFEPVRDHIWPWTFMTADDWYEREMDEWIRLHRK
jgi:hypothetical protein